MRKTAKRTKRFLRRFWRGLRKLLAFKSPPRWLLPHPEPGRILRRAAQSPLFPPQPLLLNTDWTAQRNKPQPPRLHLRDALRKIAGACLEFLVLFAAIFQDSSFVHDSNAIVANPGEDGASRFARQHLWSKHSRRLSRKKPNE